jgi:hypothetical protein
MNTAKVLSRSEYESILRSGLTKIGIDPGSVEKLLLARWPMSAPDVLAECSGRGRLLSFDELTQWLENRFQENVEPLELGFVPYLVDEFLAWAEENDVGRVTFPGFIATDHPKLIADICTEEKSPWN